MSESINITYDSIEFKDISDNILNSIVCDASGNLDISGGTLITQNHNHDSSYAANDHNHDSSYAANDHNHDSSYAANDHNHDSSYAANDHNHDSSYASKSEPVFSGEVNIETNNRTSYVENNANSTGIILKSSYTGGGSPGTSHNETFSSPRLEFIPSNATLNQHGVVATRFQYPTGGAMVGGADIRYKRNFVSDEGLTFRTVNHWANNDSYRGGTKTWLMRAYDGKFHSEGGFSSSLAATSMSSDNRLKHNETDISNSIAIINKIRPLFYIKSSEIVDQCGNEYGMNHHFTSSDLSNGLPQGCVYESGYLAQDISNISELKHLIDISPSYADENKQILALNYTGIQPYLTKAIQELHALVLEQKQQILDLSAQVAALS